MICLAIILPCYNEESVLPATISRLLALRSELVAEGLISGDSAITFVDDGSLDRTWSIIEAAAREEPALHGIKLSRNQGHQGALLAGLLSVPGDAVISIDADLQDDLGAIREMVLRHRAGAGIVYGVRAVRDSDTFFKRFSAEGYYRLMRALGVDLKFNHADYRLMSRAAIDALSQYGEVNLFLRGIVPQLGFPTADVFYARAERHAGKSKYPLRKMLSLAWNGLTSFSARPLRWITFFGVLVSVFSFAVGGWTLLNVLFLGGTVPGWASTVIPMYFLGGIQLLSIGIIGEYIAKIYLETKRRPRYIIERRV
ncbi:MAG: glycosyltransferase family 2 protein [Steroidobacteraceae bacterium]